MESEFIKWLSKNPIGYQLILILGAIIFFVGIVALFIKIKKWCKSVYEAHLVKIREKDARKKAAAEASAKLVEAINDIRSIKQDLDEREGQMKNNFDNIQSQIESLQKDITNFQKDSLDGDEKIYRHINEIDSRIDNINSSIAIITKETKVLTKASKDTLKAYLTDRCQEAEKDKYIDMHSLSICEAIYSDYLEEKGDSFIEGEMKKIRALPQTPPVHHETQQLNKRRNNTRGYFKK